MSEELTKVEKQAMEKTEEMTWAGDTFRPSVDIWETDIALTIEADVPGVRRDDVELDLRDDILTIRARVTVDEYEGLRPLYGEYNVGNFYRRFTLGEAIDQEKISAELNDGVLRLTLPKKEKVLPRTIRIS
jgi:HSP20 family protein